MTSLLLAVLIVLPDLIFHAYQSADRNGLNGDLIVAQISAESKWRVDARSPAGAEGIAQIVPRYHPTVDATDPVASIDYLIALMARYKAKYGRYDLSLAAYNAGEATVDACWCVPDYEETQRYVRQITSRAGTRPVEIE